MKSSMVCTLKATIQIHIFLRIIFHVQSNGHFAQNSDTVEIQTHIKSIHDKTEKKQLECSKCQQFGLDRNLVDTFKRNLLVVLLIVENAQNQKINYKNKKYVYAMA